MGFLRSIKISGIRSIGPGEENEVEIRFQRPFTLISGQNGAGKTTVIECLKYATSGAFPPGTTKAKGWIHFPKGRNEEAETTKTGRKRKAANVTKVPARVHLELEVPAENGDVNVISVSRKLEGTLKDGDMTTKTLEGTINIKDKRTGAPIENRTEKVEEMNRQVRQLLGVNKPVLEFAVFCHQDETLWPFEEAKSLKAKFDEIFQSAEYVKSLEQVKKVYKEANATINVQQERVNGQKFKMEEYLKRQDTIQKYSDEVVESKKIIRELTGELEKVEEEEESLVDVVKEHKEKMDAVNTLRSRCQEIHADLKHFQEMKGIEKIVEDYNESLEGIDEAIQNSDKGDDREQLEGEIAEQQEQKASLDERIKSLRSSFDKEVMKSQQFEKDEKNMAALFEREAARFPNVERLGPLSEKENQEDFIEGVSEVLLFQKEQIAEFEKNRDDEIGQNEEKAKNNSVERTKLETTISLKKKQMQDERKKIQEIEEQLRSSSQIADRHGRFLRKRDALEKDYNAVDWEGEFEEIETSLTKASDEKDNLSQQKEQLEEEEEKSQQMEDLLREKKSKEADISRMESEVRKSSDILTEIFSQIDGFTDLDDVSKDDLESWSMKYSKDFSRNEDALKRQVQALFQKQSDEKTLKKELVKVQTRLVTNREKIESEILGELVDERSKLSELTSEEAELSEKVQAMEEGKKLFKQFLSSVEKKKSCPVCTNGLSGDKLNKTIDYCKSNMSFKNGPQLKSDLDDLRSDIDKKKTHITVLEEIEKDEAEEAKITAQQKTLKSQILKLNEDKIKLEKKKKSLETIKNKLQLTAFDQFEIFTSASQQLNPVKARLVKIERELTQMGVETQKSVVDVRNELKSVKDEIKQLEAAESDLRQRQSQLSTKQRTLNEQLNKTREEIAKLEKSMGSNSEEMIQQKSQLESEVARIQAEIDSANEHLKDLGKEQSLLRAENQRIRQSFEQKINKAKVACEKIAACVTSLKNSFKQHQERYQSFSKERAEEAKQQVTEQIQEAEKELGKFIEVIEELQSRRGEFEVRKSKLQNARALLVKQMELDETADSYTKAKEEYKAFESYLHEAGYCEGNNLAERLENTRVKREEILDGRSRAEGAKTQKMEMISRLQAANAEDGEDQEKEFYLTQLQLQVDKAFARDLDKFSQALGTAIIDVHQKQMQKLNAIIAQLWKTSYQGTDIEFISISAKDSKTSASQRSNMEYCVNMHRPDGAVLSMRGRASAGQRMLASLVIRLALMETFCNSGILTLDEPTTNLDKDAIRRFAETVVDLAKTARGYNLKTQFVIITHDKEFTDILTDLAEVQCAYKLEKSLEGYTVARRIGDEENVPPNQDPDNDDYGFF